MHNGHIYTPPPPPSRRNSWLVYVAAMMGSVGILLFISAIWTGLYYTLGGQ